MALKDDLISVLPQDVVRDVPSGFQIIGDIAVVSLPPHLGDYRAHIVSAILSRHHNIRSVLFKDPIPRGDYRVPAMELVSGTTTTTLHREYGFSYRLDVTRSFFSSRLAYERRRVWTQVSEDERVLVPFAGVGPFAIPPARRGGWVTAIEKNPDSCIFLRENARFNHVETHIILFEGDLEEIIPTLCPGYDRAIIPAPYGFDRSLFLVMPLVRPGGIVHFYTFKNPTQIPALAKEYSGAGLKIRCIRRCGNVAPGIGRYVFDMERSWDTSDAAYPIW